MKSRNPSLETGTSNHVEMKLKEISWVVADRVACGASTNKPRQVIGLRPSLPDFQMAIQEAATEFDMGRGEAEHKIAWTDHIRMEYEILFSGNLKGNLWIRVGNFERSLKLIYNQVLTQIVKKRLI